MNIAVYDALTVVLIILSSTSYIPQLIRIIKTKSTKSTKSLSLVPWLLYDLYFVLYMTLLIPDNASIMVIILGTVAYMMYVIITLLILRYKNI